MASKVDSKEEPKIESLATISQDVEGSIRRNLRLAYVLGVLYIILVVAALGIDDYILRGDYKFGILKFWNTETDSSMEYTTILDDGHLNCHRAARHQLMQSILVLVVLPITVLMVFGILVLLKSYYHNRNKLTLLVCCIPAVAFPPGLTLSIILESSYLFEDYISVLEDRDEDYWEDGGGNHVAGYTTSSLMIIFSIIISIPLMYSVLRAIALRALSAPPEQEFISENPEVTEAASFDMESSMSLSAYTIIHALHLKPYVDSPILTTKRRTFLYGASAAVALMQFWIVWSLLSEIRHDSYTYKGAEDNMLPRIVLILLIIVFKANDFSYAGHRGAGFALLPSHLFENPELPKSTLEKIRRLIFEILGVFFVMLECGNVFTITLLSSVEVFSMSDEEKLSGIVQNFTAIIIVSEFDDMAGSAIVNLVSMYSHVNVGAELEKKYEDYIEEANQHLKNFPILRKVKGRLVMGLTAAVYSIALIQNFFVVHNWVYKAYDCSSEDPRTD